MIDKYEDKMIDKHSVLLIGTHLTLQEGKWEEAAFFLEQLFISAQIVWAATQEWNLTTFKEYFGKIIDRLRGEYKKQLANFQLLSSEEQHKFSKYGLSVASLRLVNKLDEINKAYLADQWDKWLESIISAYSAYMFTYIIANEWTQDKVNQWLENLTNETMRRYRELQQDFQDSAN